MTNYRMRAFFVATAAIEAGAGIGLIAAPSVASSFLGTAIQGEVAICLARIAGAGLLALGTACWLSRNDEKSQAGGGLIVAMLLYNMLAATVLAYAGAVARLAGVAIWPGFGLHTLMAIWCVVGLRGRG